jgi:hypothetical protein
MADYYGADFVPTAIFDGAGRIVAFGSGTPEAFDNALAAAATAPAGATINASGGLVLGNGYLDVAAAAVEDVSGSRVFVRAVLVEDHLPSPADGRDLRFVARVWLGNLRLDEGRAEGRFTFAVDPSWVPSRLGAVLFVQSEGPVEGAPPPGGLPPADFLAEVLLPVSTAAMVAVAALLFMWLTRRERRR